MTEQGLKTDQPQIAWAETPEELLTRFEVEDFPEWPNPEQVAELRYLLSSNLWDLSLIHKLEYRLIMTPKISEGIKKLDDGTYVDTRIASIDEGVNVRLNDFSYLEKFPLEEKPGLMHRGLSWEEMQEIQETGLVQSRGDQVQFIDGHQGLTFYSRDPFDCLGFAEHATTARRPTFNYPHYIVTVHCPPRGHARVWGFKEVGIEYAIPTNLVLSAIEVRPLSQNKWQVPLETDKSNTRIRVSGPTYAWFDMPSNFVNVFKSMDLKKK